MRSRIEGEDRVREALLDVPLGERSMLLGRLLAEMNKRGRGPTYRAVLAYARSRGDQRWNHGMVLAAIRQSLPKVTNQRVVNTIFQMHHRDCLVRRVALGWYVVVP